MTVLSVIQSSATVLGTEIPSVVFTNTTRTWIEMQTMVNACARQILEEYDWSRLKKVATITGDDARIEFPLPDDYDRMVKDAGLWGRSFILYPTQQVADTNVWLELLSYPIAPFQPRWSLFGGNINILPPLPASTPLSYSYVSNNIVNGDKLEFTADTDTFTLDERLLRLCLIYNWKMQKGEDYVSELQQYQDALGRATYKDTGSRQNIVTGGRRGWAPLGLNF